MTDDVVERCGKIAWKVRDKGPMTIARAVFGATAIRDLKTKK